MVRPSPFVSLQSVSSAAMNVSNDLPGGVPSYVWGCWTFKTASTDYKYQTLNQQQLLPIKRQMFKYIFSMYEPNRTKTIVVLLVRWLAPFITVRLGQAFHLFLQKSSSNYNSSMPLCHMPHEPREASRAHHNLNIGRQVLLLNPSSKGVFFSASLVYIISTKISFEVNLHLRRRRNVQDNYCVHVLCPLQSCPLTRRVFLQASSILCSFLLAWIHHPSFQQLVQVFWWWHDRIRAFQKVGSNPHGGISSNVQENAPKVLILWLTNVQSILVIETSEVTPLGSHSQWMWQIQKVTQIGSK